MVTEEHITAFGWAHPQDIDEILALSLRVNDFLAGLFLGIGLRLVDVQLEFGRLWENEHMRIVLADEISPDNCRLWDLQTNEPMDKDRFSKDLGRVEEAYQEVARRLGILPESGPSISRVRTPSNKYKQDHTHESESSRDPKERRSRSPGQGCAACP